MKEEGTSADDVRARLAAWRQGDVPFEGGRILGSMCTTPHPIAVEAYHRFLDTNLGDPWLNPGTAEVEHAAMRLVLDLLHAGTDARGLLVTGGSEANVTAMLLAREATGRRVIVLPESAHFSFDKAARYLDMEARTVPCLPDGTVDVAAVEAALDDDVAAVVAIAGTTELGAVDDVPALARLAQGVGAHLHVDAALGGFVIPFARDLGRALPDFDLAVPGVTTVTVDPHKMGLAPSPAGVLAVRDGALLDRIAVASPYVSTTKQHTVQGTRSGAPAAAIWAVMTHLGREGYRDVVAQCLATTRRLQRGLEELGVDVVTDPRLNVVAFRVAHPETLRRELRDRGLLVGRAPKVGGLKVVVMPHVFDAAVDALLAALEDILAAKSDGSAAATGKAPAPPGGG